jgi:hypothetical protein
LGKEMEDYFLRLRTRLILARLTPSNASVTGSGTVSGSSCGGVVASLPTYFKESDPPGPVPTCWICAIASEAGLPLAVTRVVKSLTRTVDIPSVALTVHVAFDPQCKTWVNPYSQHYVRGSEKPVSV